MNVKNGARPEEILKRMRKIERERRLSGYTTSAMNEAIENLAKNQHSPFKQCRLCAIKYDSRECLQCEKHPECQLPE